MRRIVTLALAVAATALPISAQAEVSTYNVAGGGINATINLTYSADPNTGPLGTSPNTHDPVGSYVVTGISGTFSDTNIGLINVPISGLVPINPMSPTPTNLLAPSRFGFYLVSGGLPSPAGTSPGLSYDNLYYPGGSPQTASDYPFHGGVFDIYGLMFQLSGGDAVNLWSNGFTPAGLSYGIGITNGTRQSTPSGLLDRRGGIMLSAVPEPASWAMMLLGFAGIGFAVRRKSSSRPTLRLA